MATTAMPFDPRQPRYSPGDSLVDVDGPPRQRPGGLTAVCVIAIVLGAMGLLTSLLALGGRALKEPLENAMRVQPQPGMSEDFAKAQKEMQDVGQKYPGITMGITVLNLVIASSLIAGAIMVLNLNPKARTLLVAVFAAAIVFEIVGGGFMVFIQLDMAPAMSRMMTANTPKGGPGAEQAAVVTAMVAKVVMFLVIALRVGWILAKIVFYGFGARYLCRPNIRQLFQTTTTDQA